METLIEERIKAIEADGGPLTDEERLDFEINAHAGAILEKLEAMRDYVFALAASA